MRREGLAVNATVAAMLAALLSFVPGTVDGQQQAGIGARGQAPPVSRQLTLFDGEGKPVSTLGEPGLYGPPSLPAFSPDGTRLAIRDANNGGIRVFELTTGKSTLVAAAPAAYPIWSPDARHIAFIVNRGGSTGLYRIASDGTGSEELLYRHTPGAGINFPDWSPDGRFLVFTSGGVLYVLPLDGAQSASPLLQDEYTRSFPRLSPDGRFLAYGSDESGQYEVYVHAFDPSTMTLSTTGGKWRVSTLGLRPVGWRQDGKALYYVAPGPAGQVMMAVEVSTTPTFTLTPPRVAFQIPPFAAPPGPAINGDGQRIALAVGGPPPPPPERDVIAVAPEILATYVGTYAPKYEESEIVVTREDGQLMIQPAEAGTLRGEKQPLLAETETYFYTPGSWGGIEFVADDTGVVTHVVRYPGGAVLERK